MANIFKPVGLAPVKTLNGNDWDGRGTVYYIAASDTNAYSVGDPVKLVAQGDPKTGVQGVTLATAGATMVGAILAIGTTPTGGPFIDPTNLTLVQAPATKIQPYYAIIADDPMTLFEIQEISTGTPGPSTVTSKNANFIYVAPGTNARYSGVVLDNTTFATTATLNLKLMGAKISPDNTPFTVNQKWIVKINNHSYGPAVAGI